MAVVAAVTILCVRVWMLARYSSSMPSWDAWGMEPTILYAYWLDGTFAWSNLWAWHNEHRIFFTRIFDLLLFLGNEMQWDVRVQTMASGTLYAATAGISIRWILRNIEAPLSFGLAGLALLCALSPNGWANAFQGFQSCFYFVLLFALLSIRTAAQTPVSLRNGVLTSILLLAAVFSLAAGVLAAIICVIVAIVRIWIERVSWQRAFGFVSTPLAVAIWSLVDAQKGVVHPATLNEFLHSLAIMMSWPHSSYFGVLLWLPPITYAIHVLRTRSASDVDLVFGGVILWVLLIDLGAAWTRGYNFVDVQSRYTDLLIPGLIAQVYFSFRAAELLFKRYRRSILIANVVATCVTGLLCLGLAASSVGEFHKWKASDFYSRIGATYVRAYLDGDADALDGRIYGYVPYPDPQRLKFYLAAPRVKSLLPLSITPSVPLADQRVRSCRWIPDDDSRLPLPGHVTCDARDQNMPGDGQFFVGRLSALTYRMWSLIGRQSYPALQRDDEERHESNGQANCAVDTLDGIASPSGLHHVPFADVITFAGWIGPNAVDSKSPSIRFELDSKQHGRFSVKTVAGIARPDLVKWVKADGYEHGGFQVYLDGSVLPAGTYSLSVSTATGARCETGIDVAIDHDSDIRLAY